MSLEPAVAGLILLTALMHASWNAVVKSSSDRLLTATLVTGTGSVLAAFLLPWSGVPDRAAWPYLGSSLVVHSIYLLSLVRSYRDGDLSQVYPIARGLAPPLVALLSLHFAGQVTDPDPGGRARARLLRPR